MASVNKVIIVGNLGRDPELREFQSGDKVANVTIATTDKWKDKQTGEAKQATEWHRVVFNGRLAEIAGQYLRKGSQVYVEGSIRTRKWTDKEGVERYNTEIRADSLQMLGGGERQDAEEPAPAPAPAPRRVAPAPVPPKQQGAVARGTRTPAPAPAGSGFDNMDDDIPF